MTLTGNPDVISLVSLLTALLRLLIECVEMVPLGTHSETTGIEAQSVFQETVRVLRTSNRPQNVATVGPQKETTAAVLAPVESQEDVQGAAVAPGTSETPPVEDTSGSGKANVEKEAVPSPQDVLCLISKRYLENVKPSTREEFNEFLQYIERAGAVFVGVTTGSLIVMVECGSLEILERLWEDYRTGYLNEVAQKCLVTEEILKAFGLAEVKLSTTIKEEEYRTCRELLSKDSGMFTLLIGTSIL